MYPQTYSIKKKQINYFNVFPKNRDFYFLDNYEKIKDFKTTNFEDPEYICVIAENNHHIKENLYIRKDFINDYEFIKVTEKTSNFDLNFIASEKKINIGGAESRLLTEIKARPILVKEIYKRSKINFDTNEQIYLKELFSVPNELKFYNRIFKLYFQGSKLNINLNNQNQQNNNYNNNFNMNFNYANNFSNNNQLMNNNHINNNAFALNEFNNINNINNNNNNQILNNNNFNSYKNKEDRKGHTGFL